MKRKASDEFKNLRHRFGRVIEVELAYEIFNKGEIHIGSNTTISSDFQRKQITHTLLVSFYSFLYSLFDKQSKAISFSQVLCEIKKSNPTAKDLIEIGILTIEEWNKISNSIERIRHNIGFHFSKSESGKNDGYNQFKEFNPNSPYLVLQGLRFFFRVAYNYYDFDEKYVESPKETDSEELIKILKEEIK